MSVKTISGDPAMLLACAGVTFWLIPMLTHPFHKQFMRL